MNTREEKISKIMDVMADKTLSFGCKIKHPSYHYILLLIEPESDGYWVREADKYNYFEKINKVSEYDVEIIGHPVMIGDCLDWMEKNGIRNERKGEEAYGNWYMYEFIEARDLRKPIEEQSSDLIDFILSLIECTNKSIAI